MLHDYTNSFLYAKFHKNDLGHIRYILGVEVNRSKKGTLYVSILDLLVDIQKLEAKAWSTPMVANMHPTKDDSVPFNDPEKYKRFVEKLNYLKCDSSIYCFCGKFC